MSRVNEIINDFSNGEKLDNMTHRDLCDLIVSMAQVIHEQEKELEIA